MKIATHNSATGEGSKNFLHLLFSPFAKCQDKTVREQYDCGVRYFDLRVDKDLVLCHGLWKSDKTLATLLREMKGYVDDTTYITVTIEREYGEDEYKRLLNTIRNIVNLHKGEHLKLVYIAKKKPMWDVLNEYRSVACVSGYLSVPTPRQYLTLYYSDWRRYIPVPRVLKRITPCKEYNDRFFVMVDFV